MIDANGCPGFYIRYPGFKKKALTFSFDDGPAQDEKFIKILNGYRLKCTFNLHFARSRISKMTRDEILSVYNESDGHEVATHSYSHPFLNQIPDGTAAYEILECRRVLEEIFSKIIRGFAYPMGTVVCSREVVETVRRCGVAYARTTAASRNFNLPDDWMMLNPTCHYKDGELFNLADKFINDEVRWTPEMFYVWGHTYEFDGGDGWDRIEKFCEKTAGRDDIWYATNIEICDYVNACRQVQSSIKRDRLYNPTNTTLYFEIEHRNVTVSPGETLTV